MVTVGIHELKERLIGKKDCGAQTAHHKVETVEKAWAALDKLALEISTAWPEGVPAVQALSEARR